MHQQIDLIYRVLYYTQKPLTFHRLCIMHTFLVIWLGDLDKIKIGSWSEWIRAYRRYICCCCILEHFMKLLYA